MATDLELDPTDPLNLLLHNSAHSAVYAEPSIETKQNPDWSSIANFFPPGLEGAAQEGKANADLMGFNLSSLAMDLDFNQAMVIEPSALHFDQSSKLNYPYGDYSINDILNSQPFPFTFQNTVPYTTSDSIPQHARRLSIGSSSSSSGTSLSSLSPVLQSTVPSSSELQQQTYINDPAAELAQRVRQSAGVMRAVPMNVVQTHLNMLDSQSKLAIPNPMIGNALSPIASTPPHSFHSSSSSAASTPPPSTPPPPSNFVPAPVTGGTGGTTGVIARPKTSHTTIERRYRTNLNARIQSLRMAVPALRVLENHAELGTSPAGRKIKVKVPVGKVYYGKVKLENNPEEEELVDIVDERGFVDGVKVARKCSKANVLGKAVEYIRVLKKREHRLKREREGLKSLISGLVGGTALLHEWEREWKEKFGGEEKDEIEADDAEEADGGSDDEDGAYDDENEEAESRKRKKPKLTIKKEPAVKEKSLQPATQHPSADGAIVPEKRKRGRPRKQPPPPPVQPASDSGIYQHSEQPGVQAVPQTQQYLLAAFALFSVFNSPLTSSNYQSNRSHEGTVILSTSSHSTHLPMESAWGWRDLIQAFHLLVSVLVFASIALPWLPIRKTGFLASFSRSSGSPNNNVPPAGNSSPPSLTSALSHHKRGAKDEVDCLRAALRVSRFQLFDVLRSSFGSPVSSLEQKSLEQRAWVRLGELCVLSGESISLWQRLQAFLQMRAHLPSVTSTTADLSTLAMLAHQLGRFGHSTAQSIWDEASRKSKKVTTHVRAHEQLVLETFSVDEAIQCFRAEPNSLKDRAAPIDVIACDVVRERVKKSLETLFVKNVLPEQFSQSEAIASEEVERKKTIAAARSLGGRLAHLGDALEKMWTSTDSDLDSISATLASNLAISEDGSTREEVEAYESGLDGQIRALLTAMLLYRRVFPSSTINACGGGETNISVLLSPPPSPGGRDAKLHYSLRRALGSSVFESEDGELGASLEDARDSIIDLLQSCSDRRGRTCD